MAPVELYNDGKHLCLAFHDLVGDENGMAAQCNQFVVMDGRHGALIDPGGNMTYNGLLVGMQKFRPGIALDYLMASHADPDVIASANKWLVATKSQLLISHVWTHTLPHFINTRDIAGRLLQVPDGGMRVPLGNAHISVLSAHFMHAEGSLQFYDPVSKILFSGDVGGSRVPRDQAAKPVADFEAHIKVMEGDQRRHIVSKKVCRLWAHMVRQLDIDMIVPQHGSRFEGKDMVGRFLDWIENLPCGVDLLTQDHYRLP